MSQRNRFRYLAELLDHLATVRTDSLVHRVINRGQCIELLCTGRSPELTGDRSRDRELATRVCAACPVQQECLELELRWGTPTTGVFGALPGEDRRALLPYWRARRTRRGRGGDSR